MKTTSIHVSLSTNFQLASCKEATIKNNGDE